MPVYYESRKNKRRVNQDYHVYMEYRLNQEGMLKVFVIADGMGGLSCGEKASSMAAEKWILKLQKHTLSKEFLGRTIKEQIESLKTFSYHVMQEINEEVYQELIDQGIEGGTTLTTGILFFDTFILANCGDSPAYFYHGKEKSLVKISKEQNVAEELVRQGKTTKNSSIYLQKKNMLTDYIGKYRNAAPHVCSLSFEPGDMILLGSDGAFGTIKEEILREILLAKEEKKEQIVGDILNLAEKMGEEDNQTLLLYGAEKRKDDQGNPHRKKGWFSLWK